MALAEVIPHDIITEYIIDSTTYYYDTDWMLSPPLSISYKLRRSTRRRHIVGFIERYALTTGQGGFSIFYILFEVTSGYGTVGLSTGVPYDNYSLSGAMHKPSKAVLLGVMLGGRHRGLPLAIDRSVLLPGEDLMHQLDEHYGRGNERITRRDIDRVEEEREEHVEEGDNIIEEGKKAD